MFSHCTLNPFISLLTVQISFNSLPCGTVIKGGGKPLCACVRVRVRAPGSTPLAGPCILAMCERLASAGETLGGLKGSSDCLDCCPGGKDAAIRPSSEVTHRSARRDGP